MNREEFYKSISLIDLLKEGLTLEQADRFLDYEYELYKNKDVKEFIDLNGEDGCEQ